MAGPRIVLCAGDTQKSPRHPLRGRGSDQLLQDAVLDDHAQRGQCQTAGGQSQIARLCAPLQEGQLVRGEGRASAAPVFCQVQAGGKPQLQDQVILGAAPAVGDRVRAGDESGGVGRVEKALAPKAAVGRRPQTQVIFAVPIEAVVPALKTGAGKAGDLVLAVAGPGQLRLHRNRGKNRRPGRGPAGPQGDGGQKRTPARS